VEVLKAAAAQRLTDGQQALDLGLADTGSSGAPLEIVSSQASHLWDGLCRACGVLGFDSVLNSDEVLRDLVLARIIEPTSKDRCRAVCSPRPGSPPRLIAPSSGVCRRSPGRPKRSNGRLEALRRNVLGFRNLAHYRIRSLLHCGNLIQQINAL
jgi:hypothetical protein